MLTDKIKKVENALPSEELTAAMIGIGVAFILIGIYSKSNILKTSMIAYAIVP